MGEYLEEWLWGKQSLRPSTHLSYEAHVRRYFVPYLGSLSLDGLRPAHIERMYRELALGGTGRRPLSAATLRRIHATLMSALNTAVRRGLIERNPAATVELPRVPVKEAQVWTADEVARFLDLIATDPLCPLYLLLAVVGLRRGEAVALHWSDVDLNAGVMRIHRSAVRVGKDLVVGEPKSARSRRIVAIDDETARRLQWHAARQTLEVTRATGVKRSPELVFTTPTGAPLDPAAVSRHFDRLVARHGMPRIRLHDLRHTSASIGLAAGESLVEVSRRLGHSSITITADTYSHVAPVVAKQSAERLATLLYGTPTDPTHDPSSSVPSQGVGIVAQRSQGRGGPQ